uniref:Uncharacterized protein n=1 Tax=Ananas comosus var. bracteatus TaxID=296719 RepID=A0A6V7NIA9_ANACO|nr:unnamed protein product [Ananas comosus var. bracteatus]
MSLDDLLRLPRGAPPPTPNPISPHRSRRRKSSGSSAAYSGFSLGGAADSSAGGGIRRRLGSPSEWSSSDSDKGVRVLRRLREELSRFPMAEEFGEEGIRVLGTTAEDDEEEEEEGEKGRVFSPFTAGSASSRSPSTPARSPSPKPLHIRLNPFTANRTPPPPASPPAEPLHLRLHLRPKPFTSALSPSPPAEPSTSGFTSARSPSLPAEGRYRYLNPFTFGFTSARSPSPPPLPLHRRPNPFTSGFTSAQSPSLPAKPLHLRLHLCPKPFTSTRSPSSSLRPTYPHVWIYLLTKNPAYTRCRDKPFPAYDDINFLTQNTTASGRYTFTTALDTPPTIESSSGSSSGEDDTNDGIRMSACNISACPFKAGTSGCARNANDDGADTSRSPSPPVMHTAGASGSGHCSGSKRT